MPTPLVLIPGIQGRWEYMRPAVAALSADFHVVTFSLGDETSLDGYVDQVVRALDEQAIGRAVVLGVSFGGLIALRFAAACPERTAALVLASTPAPGWTVCRRYRLYARLPWIFGPLFLVETPWRLRAELAAAFPDARARRGFRRAALRTVLSSPISLAGMAARARLMGGLDLRADCARITAPTLVVTGERELDHVVAADASFQYARLIPGARAVMLERTGHLGAITRPETFAAIVREFARASPSTAPEVVPNSSRDDTRVGPCTDGAGAHDGAPGVSRHADAVGENPRADAAGAGACTDAVGAGPRVRPGAA